MANKILSGIAGIGLRIGTFFGLGGSVNSNSLKGSLKSQPQALGAGMESSNYSPYIYNNRNELIYGAIYNGAITQGNAGPIIDYRNDYYGLRIRARQLYKESELCAAIVNKLTEWVVGSGIKLKVEPRIEVLKLLGITVTKAQLKAFNRNVELLWEAQAQSKMFDWSGQRTLPQIERQLYLSILNGGDTLVILRVVGDCVKIQLVDGASVATPIGLQWNGYCYISEYGNRVIDGVEIAEDGRHIAYYVREGIIGIKYVRIEAYNKASGLRVATLVGLNKDSVNDIRCLPLLASTIETSQLLTQYSRYAVSAAGKRAAIAYSFEHDKYSTGEDPAAEMKARRFGVGSDPVNALGVDANGNALADKMSATMDATVINMPRGAKLVMHESKFEANVPAFSEWGQDNISTAAGIPRSIAIGKSMENYSAAKAEASQFEHRVLISRQDFVQSFNDVLYELQLYCWALSGKIKAKNYIEFCDSGNELGKQSWAHNRWYGDKYPEIDQYKNVKYLREALGEQLKGMPLITAEEAAEQLGFQGDYMQLLDNVMEQSDNRFGKPLKAQVAQPAQNGQLPKQS